MMIVIVKVVMIMADMDLLIDDEITPGTIWDFLQKCKSDYVKVKVMMKLLRALCGTFLRNLRDFLEKCNPYRFGAGSALHSHWAIIKFLIARLPSF